MKLKIGGRAKIELLRDPGARKLIISHFDAADVQGFARRAARIRRKSPLSRRQLITTCARGYYIYIYIYTTTPHTLI